MQDCMNPGFEPGSYEHREYVMRIIELGLRCDDLQVIEMAAMAAFNQTKSALDSPYLMDKTLPCVFKRVHTLRQESSDPQMDEALVFQHAKTIAKLAQQLSQCPEEIIKRPDVFQINLALVNILKKPFVETPSLQVHQMKTIIAASLLKLVNNDLTKNTSESFQTEYLAKMIPTFTQCDLIDVLKDKVVQRAANAVQSVYDSENIPSIHYSSPAGREILQKAWATLCALQVIPDRSKTSIEADSLINALVEKHPVFAEMMNAIN